MVPLKMEILKLTEPLDITSPVVFLKTDWKLILCGACEIPNIGKINKDIIIKYFIFLLLLFFMIYVNLPFIIELNTLFLIIYIKSLPY